MPPLSPSRFPLLGVAVLAAGASSRMGSPKMLLPWCESSVIGHIINVWSGLAAQVAVVHSEKDAVLNRELDRLGFSSRERIANKQPERGMFSSIQCAAGWDGWREPLRHFAIVLGDQPQLRPDTTLRPLLEFAQQRPAQICQPAWHGRPKHPVVLPKPAFLELRTTPAKTLKEFLAAHTPALIELDDVDLNVDLDYPADYEAARSKFTLEAPVELKPKSER